VKKDHKVKKKLLFLEEKRKEIFYNCPICNKKIYPNKFGKILKKYIMEDIDAITSSKLIRLIHFRHNHTSYDENIKYFSKILSYYAKSKKIELESKILARSSIRQDLRFLLKKYRDTVLDNKKEEKNERDCSDYTRNDY